MLGQYQSQYKRESLFEKSIGFFKSNIAQEKFKKGSYFLCFQRKYEPFFEFAEQLWRNILFLSEIKV